MITNKIKQPREYNFILGLCIKYQDKQIKRYDLLKRLALFDLNYEQFNHIMQQARNLTGKVRNVRI
jgi:hypothetical protein